MRPLIIFTDLDGTLLDHDSYSWEPAAAAIKRIANNEIPLIVNTSKTMTEVLDIRRALNNGHPFIIENGGAVCIPAGYFKDLVGNGEFHLELFGKAYPEILKILTSIREQYHFSFKGFADISAEELADLTGLALEHAVQAKQRDCSEPVIWTDSEKSFQKFCTLLQEHHLQVISGGRFFHVMGQTDKGSAMGWLLNQYRSAYPNHKFTSIALGDSPNDLPMLEQADYSVVIKSSSGKSLMLNKMENAIYTRECGPVGWQIAIEKLLEQLWEIDMGNFYQNGVITTLHNLTRRPLAELEEELERFAARRPMSLVLPSLFSELEGPALGPILDEISKVNYLNEIVIGLDRADQSQFKYAKEYFGRLPQHHRILWNDGPRLRAIDKMLADKGLAPTEMGKGRNVWYCYGYILASGRAKAIGLHDCDIVTYNRELLARLFYPVANPNFNYQFCKGYYSRIANGTLNGRACRLLVTPLLKSMQKVLGYNEYLEYMDSFRYALAGEFSMRVEVLNDLRIPSDWGLEIGVISEMFRNYATNRICQVHIADTYDHKHQDLSADNPQGGLSRMSTDIVKAVVRKLATQGHVFSLETFRTLKATYFRTALDLIEAYYNDAIINGLTIDRHKEEKAVELFAENIMRAGEIFLQNPMETPFMPSWNRVVSAIPDIFDHLYEAVEADNKE